MTAVPEREEHPVIRGVPTCGADHPSVGGIRCEKADGHAALRGSMHMATRLEWDTSPVWSWL